MASTLMANGLTENVKRRKLSNGLTILTKEVHTRPIVAAMIWYRVGARDEELGQTGKSHFLEHMLFKGTDKYKKGDIDLITMQNGGRNNAFTWLDFTAYYFTFASDRWEIALEIEASRIRDTLFAQEEFTSEKQVVIEELQIGQDGPWDSLEEEVWATAFRQHPYHNPTVGWVEDLLDATVDDMKSYYDQWYHPQNATIVLVGDFQTEKAVEKIEALFSQIPAGPEIKRRKIIEPPQKGEKRVLVRKPTPVERLMIGYHAPEIGHPDSYPLQVMSMILSAGRRSRLYQKLQEEDRSVTYARATYNDHIDPTLFYFQAEVKPTHKLADVEASILSVIEDLKNNPVSDSELAKARRQIQSNFILGNEDVLNQATLLGQFETIACHDKLPENEKGYKYLANYLEHVNNVTAQDIQRVAQEYFTNKNRTVGHLISDDRKESESLEEGESVEEGATHDHIPQDEVSVSMPGAAEKVQVQKNQAQDFLPSIFQYVSFRGDSHLDRFDLLTQLTKRTDIIEKPSAPTLDIERVVLPNGIILLLGENHTIPAISINAVVGTGSRYEADEKTGLASLLGDMLDEGTTTRSAQQLAEEIEQVGGHLQTFGGYGQSGVSVTVLSPDLDLGLELIADVLINSTIPADRFEQQRDRRLAQIKSRNDDPRVVASDSFNEIVYKGHPAHKPRVGYEKTISSLTQEDLINFYRHYFIPNNTTIAIVGDINKSEIKEKIERVFVNWKPVLDFKLPEIPKIKRQTAPVKQFITKDKEQINLYLGHLGVARNHPDYYALVIMDTILGSSPGFTSRIPRLLRDEQGLAYTTFSNIAGSAGLDPGRFIAYIGTSPENMELALTGMMKEIRRIREEPVLASEIKDAIDYLTGSFVFNFETNAQIAGFLVEAEVFKLGFNFLTDYPKHIRAVTIEDVQRVAKEHLDPDNMTLVVVGPIDQNGKSKSK
ncbi:MAG: insulinase family protein [Acidobacteria bacterium]|nr:insulinase family protein [Acidobacteriota bacterium]